MRFALGQLDWLGINACAAFVSTRTSPGSFSLTHGRTKQLRCMFQPSDPKPKIQTPKMGVLIFILVGAAGFEPTLAESESDVLPLNYAPIRRTIIYYILCFAIFFMNKGNLTFKQDLLW